MLERSIAKTALEKIRSSQISNIEVLKSARLGTKGYDFDSLKIIKMVAGQIIVFEVKSKIDHKIYVAKRL
jgi:hypothetical protein